MKSEEHQVMFVAKTRRLHPVFMSVRRYFILTVNKTRCQHELKIYIRMYKYTNMKH